MNNEISEQQWNSWLEDPVTRMFIRLIHERRWDITRYKLSILGDPVGDNWTRALDSANGEERGLVKLLNTTRESLVDDLRRYEESRSNSRMQIKEMLGVEL